jgi:hypothetical protein
VDENFSEHQEMPSSSPKKAEKEEFEEKVGHEKRVVKEWKMETKGEEKVGRIDIMVFLTKIQGQKYGMDEFEEEGRDGHGRELTPQEEAELQREIDQLRRTPSPRYPDQSPKPQKPQAPQFLRSYFNNDESTSSGLDSTVTSLRLLSVLKKLLIIKSGKKHTKNIQKIMFFF